MLYVLDPFQCPKTPAPRNKSKQDHPVLLTLMELSLSRTEVLNPHAARHESKCGRIPAKKRIQTRIVSASAVKRVLDLLSVKETPINYYAAIILITEIRQNISGESLRFENSFHIWINIYSFWTECLTLIQNYPDEHNEPRETLILRWFDVSLLSG